MTLTTVSLEAYCSVSSLLLFKNLWFYFLSVLGPNPEACIYCWVKSQLPFLTLYFWAGFIAAPLKLGDLSSVFETFLMSLSLFTSRFPVARKVPFSACSPLRSIQTLLMRVSGRGCLFCFISWFTSQAQRHYRVLPPSWDFAQVNNFGLNIISS